MALKFIEISCMVARTDHLIGDVMTGSLKLEKLGLVV